MLVFAYVPYIIFWQQANNTDIYNVISKIMTMYVGTAADGQFTYIPIKPTPLGIMLKIIYSTQKYKHFSDIQAYLAQGNYEGYDV